MSDGPWSAIETEALPDEDVRPPAGSGGDRADLLDREELTLGFDGGDGGGSWLDGDGWGGRSWRSWALIVTASTLVVVSFRGLLMAAEIFKREGLIT